MSEKPAYAYHSSTGITGIAAHTNEQAGLATCTQSCSRENEISVASSYSTVNSESFASLNGTTPRL